MNLRINIYTETVCLEQLKSEWDELLKNSNANIIFLTWEWINSWWEVYGDRYRLYIVTVRDSDGRLLAIAPFKIALKKFLGMHAFEVLEFIGAGEDVTPEHLDLIIRKGTESKVAPFIIEYLLNKNDFQAFDLKPFSSESPNISIITNIFKARKAFYEIREHSICPVVNLPDSWDEYFHRKSKNFRKKMKEYSRRCQRDLNIKLVKCNSLENMNKHIDWLIALNHNRWNGRSKAFRTKKYVDFHKKIAGLFIEKDYLRLSFLMERDKVVAGIYCLSYDSTYFYYQSGRDLNYARYDVGLVLINMVIEEAIKEGVKTFNFLTGDEAYKFRWAEGVKKNLRVLYWKDRMNYIFAKALRVGKIVIRKDGVALRGNKAGGMLPFEGSKE